MFSIVCLHSFAAKMSLFNWSTSSDVSVSCGDDGMGWVECVMDGWVMDGWVMDGCVCAVEN